MRTQPVRASRRYRAGRRRGLRGLASAAEAALRKQKPAYEIAKQDRRDDAEDAVSPSIVVAPKCCFQTEPDHDAADRIATKREAQQVVLDIKPLSRAPRCLSG